MTDIDETLTELVDGWAIRESEADWYLEGPHNAFIEAIEDDEPGLEITLRTPCGGSTDQTIPLDVFVECLRRCGYKVER